MVIGLPVSGFTHTETGSPSTEYGVQNSMVCRLVKKVEKNADKLAKIESLYLEDAEVLVLAYGSVARVAKSAVIKARETGLKAGYLRLITIWPFPDQVTRDIVSNELEAVVIPEMNLGQVAREVTRAIQGRTEVISLPKPGVELHKPKEIYDFLRRVI